MTKEELIRGTQINEALKELQLADTYLSNEHPDNTSTYWVSITSGRNHKVIKDKGLKLKVRHYIRERIKELEEEFKAL